jgi:glycosyltransferase involved in cell wall biosynthesis
MTLTPEEEREAWRRATAGGRGVELDELPFENELPHTAPRLLLLLPWVSLGGTDKFSIDLVAQLARLGWATTAVTTEDGDHSWLPELERATPDAFALSHFLAPRDYPRFLRYLVRSRRPDAILVMHSPFAYNALPYLRSLADGRPLLDFTHIDEHDWYDGGYARLSLDNHEQFDLEITASAYLKSWLVARGADAARIEPCYIGVAPSEPAPLRGDPPVVLYPCRIIDQKQPAVFFETIAELRRRGVELEAVVAGDGPLLPWLRAAVARAGLDCVRFLGEVPLARVLELMRDADVVFLPSKNEGIAASFYEALAAGVPVVGADVGGQRELVTPECGILLPRGSESDEVQGYADALAPLLGDAERRRTLGAAGRVRITEGFTLDAMGERMVELIRRAEELARTQPRAAVTPEAARAAALNAVRAAPFTSLGPVIAAGTPLWYVRLVLLRALIVVGRPVYQLGLRLGFRWIDPLKRRLVRALSPGAG